MTCNDVLKKQNLSFDKFKLLYGDDTDGEDGVKTVMLGGQTYEIDKLNYKYKKKAVEIHNSFHHYKETESFRLQKSYNVEQIKKLNE